MASNNQENNNPIIAGAITYPQRSADNAQVAPIQPRQPRNLQGLLRFAMEATKAEDAPGNSQLGPMDEERRIFLEEALRNLTVDVAEVLQNAIKVLTNTERMQGIQLGDLLPEDVQTAFSNLRDFIDDMDIANDFYKMGGFAMFPVCYGSENEEVRAQAFCILAELCQNNPFCQMRALECGLLNVLLNLLQSERGNGLAKCLYAVSCATREFPPGCRELVSQGGCESLLKALTADSQSARTRAAFLVRYLCQHYGEAKEQFIQHNLVKIISEQIKGGHDETTEHLLGILIALFEGLDPTVMQQFKHQGAELVETLQQHLKLPDLQTDQFIEEKEYCGELIGLILKNFPKSDDVFEEIADR